MQVMWVQPVDEQQAGYQIVGNQEVNLAAVGLIAYYAHDPRQAGAVEFDYLANQLLGALTRDSAAGRRRIQQRLDPIARRAPLRVPLQLLGAISHKSLPGRCLRW